MAFTSYLMLPLTFKKCATLVLFWNKHSRAKSAQNLAVEVSQHLYLIPLQAAVAGHHLYLWLLPLDRLIPRELLLTFIHVFHLVNCVACALAPVIPFSVICILIAVTT